MFGWLKFCWGFVFGAAAGAFVVAWWDHGLVRDAMDHLADRKTYPRVGVGGVVVDEFSMPLDPRG